MTSAGSWVVVACVVIMTIGQVSFKLVADNYNKVGTLFDLSVIGILAIACIMYVVSTGLWVWALRTMELSKAYPFFALGFVFVPICGALLFGEVLTLKYGIGSLLIVAGVILTGSS